MKKGKLLNGINKGNLLNGIHFNSTTFGEKASDALSRGAGSWGFIIFFMIFLVVWMMVNTTWMIFGDGWDFYPFILLNLVLSCLAAIQAPVILMSQNRQSKKDRQRFDYDYSVNRRAERKIGELQKQLDRIERQILGKGSASKKADVKK